MISIIKDPEALLGERSWRNHYHRSLVAESQGNLEIAIRDFYTKLGFKQMGGDADEEGDHPREAH